MQTQNERRPTAAALRAALGQSGDFTERPLFLGGRKELPATLFFFDGLVSAAAVSERILFPLGEARRFEGAWDLAAAARAVEGGAAFNAAMTRRETLNDVKGDLLAGFCVLLLEPLGLAFSFETKSGEQRGVEAPETEKSIKGPKQAFCENYRVNTALVRRSLRDPALRLEESAVGRRSRTRLGLLWLDGVTDPEVLAALRERIARMEPEALLSSAGVEEALAGSRRSPFPQLLATERPDKLVLGLLEGRAAILVEGLPLGFLLPTDFSEFFRVPEDNSIHFLAASFLTLLRYAALILSVFLPALYVAIALYHRQMIPIKLLLSIIASRRDVPFSTATEVLAMLLAFELLQEAGLRLPQTVGQTVSIIGGLVVGQSAVEAKVVSPVVVIIVAVAGIAGFTIPNHDMSLALRICRLAAVVLSLLFGLYGVMLGLALLLYHLASLENFGVAYMQPFAGGGGLGAFVKGPVSAGRLRKPYLTPGEEAEEE